jgi:hypothetical protein
VISTRAILSSSPRNTNIVCEGDVLLLISARPSTSIRASSEVLAAKSTYSKTLLSNPISKWKPGDPPVEITVEGSGDDWGTLCEILYNTFQPDRTLQLPEEMGKIARVASLAGKYRFIKSCLPTMEETLQHWERQVKALDDENCQPLAIALERTRL